VNTIELERKRYFDYLRVFASFAVVLLHIVASSMWSVPIGSFGWNAFNLMNSGVRWCVPVFVMISGALFLDPNRKQSIKKLYTHNIIRLLSALVFWCVVHAIETYCRSGEIKKSIQILITGQTHMWYLFMAMGLYIITPLVRKITESATLTKYFLLVGIVFTFLIPRTLNFISLLRIPDEYGILSNLSSANSKVNFNFTKGYVFYYVLGYYLSQNEIKPTVRKIIYCVGCLSVLVIANLTLWRSTVNGKIDETFYGNMTVLVLLSSVAVFTFGKYVLGAIKSKRINNLISLLARHSFGCYLVHLLVRNVFRYEFNMMANVKTEPIMTVVVLCLCTIVFSYLVSMMISKLGKWTRYII